jgi:hypothetical protein
MAKITIQIGDTQHQLSHIGNGYHIEPIDYESDIALTEMANSLGITIPQPKPVEWVEIMTYLSREVSREILKAEQRHHTN